MIEPLAPPLLALAVAFLLNVRVPTLLTYFQQEEYNPRRFADALLRVRLFDCRSTAVLLVAALFHGLGLTGPSAWLLAAIGIAVIALRERGYRYKKPLVRTPRATRIIALSYGFLILPAALVWPFPLVAIAAVQVPPLAIVAANAALRPYEAWLNRGYVRSARGKLARMNPVRIGITGSFGKTAVKHMLADILALSGPVFFSRGSVNTVLGLTRHIRQRLQWSHRYFIAEMGAYGIGSIRRLCDFAGPGYGIVTAVGHAHSERFGSLDAIAQAKSELAEAVCQAGGHMVLNAEVLVYAPFKAVREAYPDRVTSVGREEDADIRIESADWQDGAWTVRLDDRQGGIGPIAYQLSLLGEHTVINSALAVALALRIDPEIAGRIPLVTREIEQVPHRLQKREMPGRPLILDDAFNSNERGFKNAVSVLSGLATERGGRAILVTPGVAELGLEHDRIHARLGAHCNGLCDEVFAVNPERIPTFVAALDAQAVQVHRVATLADAQRQVDESAGPQDVVLYENDLPDLLEEKRLL